jgi:hypothetical protein
MADEHDEISTIFGGLRGFEGSLMRYKTYVWPEMKSEERIRSTYSEYGRQERSSPFSLQIHVKSMDFSIQFFTIFFVFSYPDLHKIIWLLIVQTESGRMTNVSEWTVLDFRRRMKKTCI